MMHAKNKKTIRKHIPAVRRYSVYAIDRYECVYCGCRDRTQLTLDHLISLADGLARWAPQVLNHATNLLTACAVCNNQRADYPKSMLCYGRFFDRTTTVAAYTARVECRLDRLTANHRFVVASRQQGVLL